MIPPDHGWKAHVVDDFTAGGRTQRLYLYQDAGNELIIITGFTEGGYPILHHEPYSGASSPYPGLVLPVGCAEAIADHVRPGPSHLELDRVLEALVVERARIDRVIDALLKKP